MPIYEFECQKTGERMELMRPLDKYKEKLILCEVHLMDEDYFNGDYPTHFAEKVWSVPGNLQQGIATRLFINPQTMEAMPAASFERVPKGYIEKELKGPIERSKFEKQDAQVQHIKDEVDTLNAQFRRDQHQKSRHDDLKARMNSLQTEVHPDTNEKIHHFLEPKTKKMIKDAMQRSKKRTVPKKVTERRFAVNHTNNSNLIDSPKR